MKCAKLRQKDVLFTTHRPAFSFVLCKAEIGAFGALPHPTTEAFPTVLAAEASVQDAGKQSIKRTTLFPSTLTGTFPDGELLSAISLSMI